MMNTDSFSHYLCWRPFQLHFLPPLHLLQDEIIPGHLLSTWRISKAQISQFTHPFTFGWKYLWISLDGKFLERIIKESSYLSFSAFHPTHTNTLTYTTVAPTSTTYFVKWCFYLLKVDRCQRPLLTLYLPISIHQNLLLIWLSISGIHYFLHLFCHYGGWSHHFLAILLQGAPNWTYLYFILYTSARLE